ncbi:MAG: PAS domain S-box protein [Bryobacteraceae bacterium]|nr:PAS domain S-box protein [Bryobacteraceae bacterium]
MTNHGDSSGERVCATFDDLPVLLWISGVDGATGCWNAKARDWFGIPREQSCGPLTEFIHPDDRETALARWGQAVSTGRPLGARFRARSAAGEYRWLELSCSPRQDSARRITGWACAFTDIHDCKLAEDAALAKADEEARILDGLLEHIPMAVVIADAPDGRVRRMSRYRLRMAGASEETSIGVPAGQHPAEFRISHPDGSPADASELPLARAIQKGEIVRDEEWRYTRPDGTPIAILCGAAPIRDRQGRVIAGLVAWNDVTRLRTEQDEFYETSQRLKTLIESSPLAVIEWDPDRRITAWVGHCESIFGWSASEVLGKRLDEFGLIHPDDQDRVRTAMDLLEHGTSNVVHNRNYHKNGSLIYCEWYNSALADRTGRLVWGLSLALDITARHEMEEAVRASEEKYRAIFEAAPVGIFRSTLAGRFISANSRIAALFGYRSPEALMNSVTNIPEDLFVHPEKRHEMFRRATESKGFVQGEVEYRRKDGSPFLANLYVRTLRDGGGATILEGFVEDITERKRAEEALREAHRVLERRVAERTAELSAANERLTELDRLKSQFLASMSHELRTPLNSIIGFTSLLRRGLAGPVNDEQVKQLGIVHSSASHLLGLINDLLDVSRIEAGRADLQHEPFDFVEVVNEVALVLKPMADRKGLGVIVEMSQPAIPMLGDRKRAFQVLLNLVNNALKFTERGTVRIAAASTHGALQVEVADTGIGIKPEQLGMLFEAFRQVDGSAKRVYEGTGLGLYLCRKLLTLMGGEIHAESEYGKGSRFVYSMPLELASELA